MRSRSLVVLAAAAALMALTVAPTAPARPKVAQHVLCVLTTHLTPAEEVRPEVTDDPVESRAFGVTIVQVREGGQLRFTTVIVNPARETFMAGHIHQAPRGANGPVVVPLFSGASASVVFVQRDHLTVDPRLAAQICGNPAAFYVNYHTTLDPQGAVRGQLG